MRIADPSFGIAREEAAPSGVGAEADWLRDPIVFFSNSKPNIKELMFGLREKFASIRDIGEVDFVWKPSAGVSADMAMIEAVASKYRIAILGSAD